MRCSFLFLTFAFLFADEVVVFLQTESDVKPLYLQMQHPLRQVLSKDLALGGYVSVMPERKLPEKDVLQKGYWRREKVPFIVEVKLLQDKFHASVLNMEKGTIKNYPPFTPSKSMIHRLSDQIYKDLFGIDGVASKKLLFSKKKGKHSEIYVSDYNGENLEPLTFENHYCVTPCFEPFGKNEKEQGSFLFVSYKLGQSKIFKGSLQTKKVELAFDFRGSQVLPAISKDGSKIAFISDAAGRPDLFIYSNGVIKQLYTAPRSTQASPTFDPTGTRLAFVSDKDGSPRIYKIDIANPKKSIQMLTKKNRENTSPCWSSDGKKIAYSAKVEGVRQIWCYDFESGEEFPLTTGPGNKENPCWAPNSMHLVYNIEDGQEGQIYLINLKQKIPLKLIEGRFPSWENRK
jgi:TolB protein